MKREANQYLLLGVLLTVLALYQGYQGDWTAFAACMGWASAFQAHAKIAVLKEKLLR